MTTNFKFMKYGRLSYLVAAALVAASLVSFITRGMNYGIDFTGGIMMEVAPKSGEVQIDKMRAELAAFKPELQRVSGGDSVMIKVGLEKLATDASQNRMVSEIKGVLGDKYEYRQTQIVGPRIGAELITAGLMAILFSFVGMSIYIWIRYSGGYAVGAFVSLVVDFLIMFGFFSVMGLEFNQTAIAVILLAMGYSINDKVVNYDRIDENALKYRKMPTGELIDLSVNEMLSRTIMTSVSTMLAMAALAVWGGDVLREFAYAMMFGIVLGTATSIWMSNALLKNFDIRKQIV
ncbi:MAG: protein translocase subunit SecF [Rickettsiales bacterium]|jgi:preprotein translocase SecF subunit|nr:protein translocase subunit SecF [Rickettsiales bacterium]